MRRYRLGEALNVFKKHIENYFTPLNLSVLWSFGSLLGFCIALQLISGIFLSFFYNSDVAHAFFSVERIMRDVNYGWFIRYVHVNIASFIFLFMYVHIGKALYFRSYVRTKLWFSGIAIFVCLMLTAFSGYVLVWGQMSLWAATVITNFFSSVPFIGPELVEWIWGGFTVSAPTLTRFFSIHFIAGLLVSFFTVIHLIVLHEEGSSNPLGTKSQDNVNFSPLFLNKDLFWFFVFLFFLSYFIFFRPTAFMHPANFEQANPFVTPKSIVPEWYFLPFYTVLKSIPDKVGGIVMMGASIVVIVFLPFIDKNTLIKNTKVRFLWKYVFWSFVFNFIFLGWLGEQPAEDLYVFWGQLSTTYYFISLLFIFPVVGRVETLVLRKNTKKI
jgi:quinol-cytochrome oxidoreductase complex cytochrome b subunit